MKIGSHEDGGLTSAEHMKNALDQKAMMALAYKKVHGTKELPDMTNAETRHAVVAEWIELWADGFATLEEEDLKEQEVDELLERIKPEGVTLH